jgi:hypothetical protein
MGLQRQHPSRAETPSAWVTFSSSEWTQKELQEAIGVYRDPDGFIYVLPKEIRDNTVKAFNLGVIVTRSW